MDRYLKALGQVLGFALILCAFLPRLGLALILVITLLIIALSVDDYNIAARIARRSRYAKIAARAEAQNRAFIRGDYRYGMFGEYPPKV